MNKLTKNLLGLFIAAFCLPQTAHARPVEFNLQTVYSANHIINIYAQEYADELAKVSNGELICYIFADGALMKSADVGPGLMNGTLDMADQAASFVPELTPLSATLGVPLIGDDAIHHTLYALKAYEENEDIKAEQNKVAKVLGTFCGDRGGFFSTVGPINSPADIKGKRVLTPGGPSLEYVKALGGIPVHTTAAEAYIGLQRGLGDVYMGALPMGVALKLHEVAKDITLVNMITTPNILWANWDFWNSLSPEQQGHLETLTAKWNVDIPNLLVKQTEKDLEMLKSIGVNVITLPPEELQAFKEITKDAAIEVISNYFERYNIDKDPEEWFNYIHELSASARPKD